MRRTAALALATAAAAPAGGAPASADAVDRALRFEAFATVDVLRADEPAFATALGHLDLRLSGDAERLFGWRATTIHVEAIGDWGGKPNARVASLQGLSSIEVKQNAARLYAAWLQHELAADADVLVGLYDLNSEFYVTDASSLLIHPAFGTGVELAQTGRNGPSVFPVLALGARVAVRSSSGFYGQAALLAATAGDPEHTGRTVVRVSRKEGALVVAEGGWRAAAERRHGVGHWGAGVWSYSEPVAAVEGGRHVRNAGAYVLGQSSMRDAPDQRITAFARAGVASADANAIDRAFDAGVLVQRFARDGGPGSWSAGLAFAHLGQPYRAAAAARGISLRSHELTFEVGARWSLGSQLTVQPLAQHVVHSGGNAGKHATIVGARWIWSLPGSP